VQKPSRPLCVVATIAVFCGASPALASETWYCETIMPGHVKVLLGVTCYYVTGRTFFQYCPGQPDSVGPLTVDRNDAQAIVAIDSATSVKWGVQVKTIIINKVDGAYIVSSFDGLKHVANYGECSRNQESIFRPGAQYLAKPERPVSK
jgi:hypothetical protein